MWGLWQEVHWPRAISEGFNVRAACWPHQKRGTPPSGFPVFVVSASYHLRAIRHPVVLPDGA